MHICYCDIECLTAEDIREAFSFYVESFCCEIQEGEIESIDSETGRTENLYLQKMAEDFSKLIFYDYVSVENVLRNFNNILQVCFGICDGTDRALLVLSNNRIPSYFKIRDTLDKATRTLLDSAIECISNPLINGFLDIEPFSCQDDSHYSVIIPVGDFKGCEVTEHHFRPFYYEAACAISDYFSDKECILDENK